MGERSPYLEKGNLGLVVAVCGLWLCAGLLLVGPGRSAIAEAGDAAEEKSRREESWRARHAGAGPVSDAERAAWSLRFERLRARGAPAGDDAALMSWVAERLGSERVRGLEVTRIEGGADPASAVAVPDPFGDDTVRLVPVPIRVRFEARYRDLTRILAELEPHVGPLRVRQLELRRQFPDVHVDLGLEIWTREELRT